MKCEVNIRVTNFSDVFQGNAVCVYGNSVAFFQITHDLLTYLFTYLLRTYLLLTCLLTYLVSTYYLLTYY